MIERKELSYAYQLYKNAILCAKNHDFKESNKIIDLCLEILIKYKRFRDVYVLQCYKGTNYIVLGLYDEALKLLSSAEQGFAEILETSINNELKILKYLGTSLYEKAHALYYIGNYKFSLVNANKSLKISKSLNLYQNIPQILKLMGSCYFKRGWILKALNKFKKAKDLLHNQGNHTLLLKCIINLIEIYETISNFNQVEILIKEALCINSISSDQISYALLRENIAKYYLMRKDLIKSMKNYDISLDIYRSKKMLKNLTKCLINKGGALLEFKKNTLALNIFKEVLINLEEVNDTDLKIATFNNLCVIYQRSEEYDEAERYVTKAIQLAKNSNNFYQIDTSFYNFVAMKYWQHDLEGAFRILNDYLEDSINQCNKGLEGLINLNLGKFYRLNGDYEKAIQCFQTSRKIFFSILNRTFELEALTQLGLTYKRIGDYENVIKIFRFAKDRLGSSVDSKTAMYLDVIGEGYFNLNKNEKAKEYYFQSLRLRRRTGNLKDEFLSLNNIALIFLKKGSLTNAAKLFDRLLKKSEKYSSLEGILSALLHKGLIKLKQREYEIALELFEKSCLIAIDLRKIYSYSLIIRYTGECYFRLNKINKALIYLRIALRININFFYNKEEWLALTDLGRIYERLGKIKKAELFLTNAVDRYKESISIIKSEELRNQYRTSNINPYDFLFQFFLNQYLKDEERNWLIKLIKFHEEIRSREILNKLKFKTLMKSNEASLFIERKRTPNLVRLEKEIQQKQNYALELALEIKNGIIKDYDVFDLQKKYTKIILEIDKLIDEINENLFSKGLIYKKQEEDDLHYSLDEMIGDKNLLIWYMIRLNNELEHDEKFYIISWSKKALDLIEVQNFPKEHILTLIEEFHKNNTNSVLLEIKNELQNNLPKILFKDLESFNKLILIPHDFLFTIPWEIIDKLSLKIPLTINLSLRLLLYQYRNWREANINSFLYILNPNFNIPDKNLSYDDKKIKEISYLLDNSQLNLEILQREYASKTNFISNIQKNQYNLIHFSGHSDFDIFGFNPYLTGIYFYKSSGLDLMNLLEISQLTFKQLPFIFIDACDSSRGSESNINEPISIIRSLTAAGAGAVLGTNWTSRDRISYRFSSQFYTYLLNGYDISECLFKTREDLQEYFSSVKFWANFTLFGNPFIKYNFKSKEETIS